MFLCAVEGREDGQHVAFVGGLGGCEARLVDAVVDLVVLPGVGVFYFGAEGGRVQIYRGVVGREEVVELRAEHAEDLAGLVVDDGLLDLVVEEGDGETPGVGGVDLEVDLAEVGEGLVFFDCWGGDVLAFGVGVGGGCEAPALASHVPVH